MLVLMNTAPPDERVCGAVHLLPSSSHDWSMLFAVGTTHPSSPRKNGPWNSEGRAPASGRGGRPSPRWHSRRLSNSMSNGSADGSRSWLSETFNDQPFG